MDWGGGMDPAPRGGKFEARLDAAGSKADDGARPVGARPRGGRPAEEGG